MASSRFSPPLHFRLGLGLALALSSACEDSAVSALEPGAELTSSALDFGAVTLGQEATETVLLRNIGEVGFRVSAVEASDPAFVVEAPTDVVGPGQSTTVRVRFAPTKLGEATAEARFRLDAGGLEPLVLSLQGVGVDTRLRIEPRRVDFGGTLIGEIARAEVAITNEGRDEVELYIAPGPGVFACDGGVFCYETTERPLLGPGQTLRLELRHRPNVVGSDEGILEFAECAGCDPVPVTLVAEGLDRAVVCEPASLDFGAVIPGRCVGRSANCQNVANSASTVAGWSTRLGSSFSPLNSRIAQLAPGDSVMVEAEFCPDELGDETETMEVEVLGDDEPIRIALSGEGGGPDLRVQPEALAFGKVSIIAAATKRIAVINAGYADLTAQLSTSESYLSLSTDLVVLSPGEAGIVEVTAGPTAVGAFEATVFVESNDQSRPIVEVDITGEGVELAPCPATLAPGMVEFGVVGAGRSRRRTLNLVNPGSEECLVYDTVLAAGSEDEFSFDPFPSSIPGGEAAQVDVRFSPAGTSGLSTGRLEVSVSSPQPPLEATLRGRSGTPVLLVAPSDIDFGSVSVDCARQLRTVTLYNTGAAPVTVTSIQLDAPGSFALQGLPGLPLSIPAGRLASFDVRFAPSQVGFAGGSLTIEADEAGNPVAQVINVQGSGSTDPFQTDTWTQLRTAKADILFLIDNSCSMGDEQASLRTNFDAFIDYAVQESIDYHIAITRLDEALPGFGEFVGSGADKIITPNTTPSPEAVFNTNANVGATGPGPETGFQAAYEALSPTRLAGPHAGFLRSDAVLSLIVVSDQDDLAGGYGGPRVPVDFFSAFFSSIKGFDRPDAFTFSSIVGEENQQCRGPGGNALPAPRYHEMSRRTGGVTESICSSDWADALQNLSQVAFGFRTHFPLSSRPEPATLVVEVEGMERPTSQWRYEAGTNAVVFQSIAAPEPGDDIRIGYVPACD